MSNEIPADFNNFNTTMNKVTLNIDENVGELTIDCEET